MMKTMNTKTIIILACQDLSNYENPHSPTFWETIDGYYNDGWMIYIINSFERDINFLQRDKYIYTEFPVPYKKMGAVKKVGWFFRVLRSLEMKYKYISYVEKIMMNSKEENHVVYAYEIWAISAGKAIKKKYKIPFISRFQGTSMYDKKINIMNRLRYYPHFQALETKADLVIMTNDGTCGKKFLNKIGNPTKEILFLRNGVDVPIQTNMIPEFCKEIEDQDIILMTLSRLAYWKRIDRAIEALEKIVPKYPNCKLIIVGYGDEKQNLEELSRKLGVYQNIIFAGEVSHDMVFSYISRADIFLSLYDMSNVGNPLMEAMRCGKPIITLDVGDTKEIIQNEVNGILLSVSEVDKIPDKVFELIENPDYAERIGRAAREYATDNFLTWKDRIAKEVQKVNELMVIKD